LCGENGARGKGTCHALFVKKDVIPYVEKKRKRKERKYWRGKVQKGTVFSLKGGGGTKKVGQSSVNTCLISREGEGKKSFLRNP